VRSLPLHFCYFFRSPTLRRRSTDAVADHNVASLAQGTIIQFERKGFYIVDRAFDASNPSQKVELILIPDGRASSVALKNQAPAAPAKDASKAAKTPSKDKQAAMKAKKGAEKIPELPTLAPTEAAEVVLKSDGSRGYDIPVKVSFPSSPLVNCEDHGRTRLTLARLPSAFQDQDVQGRQPARPRGV
jgi:glutamyl-tRNA synthetase